MSDVMRVGRLDLNISRTIPGSNDPIPDTYQDPLMNESNLVIWSDIVIEPGYCDQLKFLDFALQTNFMAADFSGDLTMDFTELQIKEDFIYFKFIAGLIPTAWDLEVILTIEIIERATENTLLPEYWFTLPGAEKDSLGFVRNTFQNYELPIEL